MNRFFVSFIVFTSAFLFSFSSFSNPVNSFLIDTKNSKVTVDIYELDSNYYFSQSPKSPSKNDVLLGDNQVFPLENNKSNYPDYLEFDIDYNLTISSFLTDELGYLTRGNNKNNILVRTIQEDNASYSFILAYSYKDNQIILTDVLLLEEQLNVEESERHLYKVNIKIPKSIINLANYDRKSLSEFIVNDLYHAKDDMNLDSIY